MVASSVAALTIAFLGLSQFDLPITRYVRSVTIHRPWDQLTIPWMAFTSNAGDWIGEGTHLVAFSIVLTAAGWMFSKTTVRNAGIETLLAHGLAALLVNGLKHLIGRPRPKFVHSGEWQFAPSWVSGYDSFPSGHSAASFAVATVLAKRFPALAPICLGIASFVVLSRILRGSHFPTDVLGGAVFGIVSGSIAAAPLKQWRHSLHEGILHAALGACAAFAFLWVISRPADAGLSGILLTGLGLVSMASGLWLRRSEWAGNGRSRAASSAAASVILIAYGLAAMTTSLYVLAAAGFACLAYWLNRMLAAEQEQSSASAWPAMRESAVLVGVLLALFLFYNGRGIMPFR